MKKTSTYIIKSIVLLMIPFMLLTACGKSGVTPSRPKPKDPPVADKDKMTKLLINSDANGVQMFWRITQIDLQTDPNDKTKIVNVDLGANEDDLYYENIILNSDGSALISNSGGNNGTGSWSLSTDAKTFTVSPPNSQPVISQVVSLDDKAITLVLYTPYASPITYTEGGSQVVAYGIYTTFINSYPPGK